MRRAISVTSRASSGGERAAEQLIFAVAQPLLDDLITADGVVPDLFRHVLPASGVVEINVMRGVTEQWRGDRFRPACEARVWSLPLPGMVTPFCPAWPQPAVTGKIQWVVCQLGDDRNLHATLDEVFPRSRHQPAFPCPATRRLVCPIRRRRARPPWNRAAGCAANPAGCHPHSRARYAGE